jgi:hypothetical protein
MANWIKGAIKHPGALHRQLGVPEGQKIPTAKLDAAAGAGGKLGQRARLAKTLKGFEGGGSIDNPRPPDTQDGTRPGYKRGGRVKMPMTPPMPVAAAAPQAGPMSPGPTPQPAAAPGGQMMGPRPTKAPVDAMAKGGVVKGGSMAAAVQGSQKKAGISPRVIGPTPPGQNQPGKKGTGVDPTDRQKLSGLGGGGRRGFAKGGYVAPMSSETKGWSDTPIKHAPGSRGGK